MPHMEINTLQLGSGWSSDEATLAQGIFKEFDKFAKSRLLHKKDHQRKMPLWLFLIAVLRADHKQICLSWKSFEKYEFVVKDKKLVAKLWGLLKQNPAMDYLKLTRALRYYYKKELIEKAIDQPYTYRFIASEKTLRYLPTQEEIMQYRSEEKTDNTNQRTKSLPDFLSVFSSLVKKEKQPTTSKVPAPADSGTPSSCMKKRFTLGGVKRERIESLPNELYCWRQGSDALSLATSTDSSPDVPLSPTDDLKENCWSDSMDEFLFGERKYPQKVPLTACFKACDMPLLNFQDLLKLEEGSSDCFSSLSPEDSERSHDVDMNNDTSFWISQMKENPELKLPLKMEIPSYETGSMQTQHNSNREKAVDMDIEMEFVTQVIDPNDA